MDEARATLIAIVSSLSRLMIRLHKLDCSQRTLPSGKILSADAADWTVGDLSPKSPWFDAAAQNMAVSGAIGGVALVQAHLMAMIEAPGEIDGWLAVRVVEHLCHGAYWSERVEALAKRLGVDLPGSPMAFHNGASLHQISLPRRGERHHIP